MIYPVQWVRVSKSAVQSGQLLQTPTSRARRGTMTPPSPARTSPARTPVNGPSQGTRSTAPTGKDQARGKRGKATHKTKERDWTRQDLKTEKARSHTEN